MNKEERTFCTLECDSCLDTSCESFMKAVEKQREEIQKYRKDLFYRDITFLNCPKCNEKIQVNFSRGMHELQQENKELKEKYLNAVSDYENEKSKNQKAIEYFEQPAYKGYLLASLGTHYFKLLEILKGDSNE